MIVVLIILGKVESCFNNTIYISDFTCILSEILNQFGLKKYSSWSFYLIFGDVLYKSCWILSSNFFYGLKLGLQHNI